MRIETPELFLFSEIENSFSSKEYKEIKLYLEAVDAFSRTTQQCVYVIDLFKESFLYVSDSPVFLCRNKTKEVKRMGYRFYTQYVHPDDLVLLGISMQAVMDFYNTLPIYDRQNYSLSFDCRLQLGNGQQTLINQKLTVLALKEYKPWLALCIVSQSREKNSGNVSIQRNSNGKKFVYDHVESKWQIYKGVVLSQKEKEVLTLCAKGCTSVEVAKELNISGATVKFHKKNIFKKLQVKNTAEAISMAIASGLIK